MDRKTLCLALAPLLLSIGATIYITQGQRSWVWDNHWLAPLLIVAGAAWFVAVLQWDKTQRRVRILRSKFRGEPVYIVTPARLSGSSLDLNSISSMTLRPKGTGHFTAATVLVRNAEDRFRNVCEGVSAVLRFKHAHLEGQDFKKDGWFVQGGPEIERPAAKSIDLKDGEFARLILFVSGPRGIGYREASFYLFNESVFHPNFQPALPTGDWYLTIEVQSKLEKDRALARIHFKINRDGSSGMGFLQV